MGKQRAAGGVAVIDHHDRAAGGARGKGRAQARRAGADDEHIDAAMNLIRPRLRRRLAEAPEPRHGADLWLEHMPVRPQEGLVVEARRQEFRETVDEGEAIGLRGRRSIDTAGDETIHEGDGRRLGIGLRPVTDGEVDQRVRLFHARSVDAARTVILEASTDDPHAVRQQRGGERVAGKSRIGPPVEGEAQAARAIDLAPAAVKPRRARHREASPWPSSRKLRATSWLTALRSMPKKRPQPP
jgi:hypothetical protein